ncbi:MAG: SRPBCC family protein [Actinomycetota bacterium]|nr:SRPBCC family protein [Actinomycetota bacterium]
MKFYKASTTIQAPPDAVWAILTDAPGYSRWDSGVERGRGRHRSR